MADAKDRQAQEADVEIILASMEFPASKDDLVDAAQDAEMDEMVVVFFEALPNKRYTDRTELDTAIKEKMAEGEKENLHET